MNRSDLGLAVALGVLVWMIVKAPKGITSFGPLESLPYLPADSGVGPLGRMPTYEEVIAHPELYGSPSGLTPAEQQAALFGGPRVSPLVGVAPLYF